MCDKIVERAEKFDIKIVLTSNNAQLSIGRSESEGIINDSTGKQLVNIHT